MKVDINVPVFDQPCFSRAGFSFRLRDDLCLILGFAVQCKILAAFLDLGVVT